MVVRFKTAKARGISSIIESSLLGSTKLKFLVFGPADGADGYETHRVAVKNKIIDLGQIADFPEDLDLKLTGSDNPLLQELELMQEYDCTIIVMISIGSIAEYVTFVRSRQVVHKIRLFVDKKHQHSEGFLNSGLIEPFNRVYKQVFYFNHANHLLRQVRKMVKDMIILDNIQRA